MEIEQIKALIRDVPDFPEPGIVFKDITPVLAHPDAMSTIIDLIVVHFGRGTVDKVVGIEARGFILAAPVAYHFNAGFVPIRKAGKLPWETESEEYELEYGTATIELHKDAIEQGERVLIVDDVLATGRDGEGRRVARRALRRRDPGDRLSDRARVPEGPREAPRLRAPHVHPLLGPACPPSFVRGLDDGVPYTFR